MNEQSKFSSLEELEAAQKEILGEEEKPKCEQKIFIILIVVFSILFGVAGFFAGKYLKIFPNKTVSQVQPINNEFFSSIERIWSLEGTNSKYKKLVMTTHEVNTNTYSSTLLLTSNDLNSENAKELLEFTTPSYIDSSSLSIENDTRSIFFVYITGPGDSSQILLADSTGKIISTNVIEKNADKLGLGTTLKGMIAIKPLSLSDLSIENGVILVLEIMSGDEGIYQANINALTGEYVEGSMRQIN